MIFCVNQVKETLMQPAPSLRFYVGEFLW